VSSLLVLREAIASTALSHPEGHDCDVCKAAAGDRDAFTRILVEVYEGGR
jgi:hypothetical protein